MNDLMKDKNLCVNGGPVKCRITCESCKRVMKRREEQCPTEMKPFTMDMPLRFRENWNQIRITKWEKMGYENYPPLETDVLAFTEHGDIRILNTGTGKGWLIPGSNVYISISVTYWMPLPNPPRI